MEVLYMFIIIINFLIAYFLLKKIQNTKYDIIRKIESRRYFNGSLVNKNEGMYKSRRYKNGLCVKKTGDNSVEFLKQAKIYDTSILY